MTWSDALDLVVKQTGHERYRDLCADEWPDHTAYRALMIRLATGQGPAENQTEDKELRDYVAAHPCGGC